MILTSSEIPGGGAALDVGCGSGSLINEIRQKGAIDAYGVDISPNMIEECRKQYPDISFEVSSGEQLPFENDRFELLTICCALHHFNNPRKFFLEAHRVLKAGGILIVAEPWYPFGLKQIADCILLPRLQAGANKLFSHRQLRQMFTGNGFSISGAYRKDDMQLVQGLRLE